MSDWQPIETAPRDGRRILLGDAYERFVAEGFWEADYGDGYWCRANEHWTDAHDTNLGMMTHWQPLPAPPDL